MTRDLNPLQPKVLEFKFYARGVGPVLAVGISGGSDREELVRYSRGGEGMRPLWLSSPFHRLRPIVRTANDEGGQMRRNRRYGRGRRIAAVAALAIGGVGIAQAVGGDSEAPVTGPAAEHAKAAALEGGRRRDRARDRAPGRRRQRGVRGGGPAHGRRDSGDPPRRRSSSRSARRATTTPAPSPRTTPRTTTSRCRIARAGRSFPPGSHLLSSATPTIGPCACSSSRTT